MDTETVTVFAPAPDQTTPIELLSGSQSNAKVLESIDPKGPSTETVLARIVIGATLAAAVLGCFGARP